MNNLSIFDRKNRVSDKVLNFLIQFCSALSVLILVVCIGYILYRGIPHFNFSYLVNSTSILKGTIGILPNIINTLYIIVVTLLFACPIGIGGAIYLNEYGKKQEICKCYIFYNRSIGGNSFYYLWVVWDVVFWKFVKIEIFNFNRFIYTCNYDLTNYF